MSPTMVFNGFKRKHAMDVVEALAGLEAGRLVLVDVREESERARGFAPGSRHLPLTQLKQRLDQLPSDRPGGMTAWERHGLDIDRGTA